MKTIKILMNGVTGQLGASAHLADSLMAIRAGGGLVLSNGETLMPVPVLAGRDAGRLEALSALHGGLEWTTEIDQALADPEIAVYFDTSVTAGRYARSCAAIAAGKHIYIEKPVSESLDQAIDLARRAEAAGICHGTVQDKVFLPGLRKMKRLIDSGHLGRIHSIELTCGWWVFDGIYAPGQRPTWNFTSKAAGGIVLDMSPHWRYITETLFDRIVAVTCRRQTCIPQRRNEAGDIFDVDVDDACTATYELANGALLHLNASWATRMRREDMLIIQADGDRGSARSGLHQCWYQALGTTPRPTWNVEHPALEDHFSTWSEVPAHEPVVNGYRGGWESFLRHIAEGTPFASPLIAGARGIQLVEASLQSDAERRWISLPEIS